jgi:hypothetical protein
MNLLYIVICVGFQSLSPKVLVVELVSIAPTKKPRNSVAKSMILNLFSHV